MVEVPAILVVSTSVERQAVNAALLRAAGYAVRDETLLGDVAATLLAQPSPLLVADFARDDVEAQEVCRTIKHTHAGTFILHIAPAGFDPNIAASDYVDALLIDPIDRDELLALVRSLLRLQRAEADLRQSEVRLQLAQDSAGLAILDWTISSNRFVHSANFADLLDLDPALAGRALTANDITSRIHPDDLQSLVASLSADSRTAGSFEREFRIKRRDGTVRWIASRGRFFTDAAGTPERMLALSYDITQRKEAERANAVLASIVASSSDAIISVDAAALVTSWNEGAATLFGIAAAQMIGRPLAVALSDTSEPDREAYHRRIMDGQLHELETRQKRRDGTPIDIWVRSAPICDDGGRVIGASLIVRDVSAQQQREEHNRFLMRELTHRSKNLLAVIQAMARQSLSKDISPEEFVRRFSNRLAGLAGSHDLLSSVQWRGVSLMGLINSQLNHYADLFGTRIVVNGRDIVVRPEAAQNIGIALHELSTNAAKYGALSNEAGHVTIAWSVSGDTPAMFNLQWEESGGPPVQTPKRQGFGRTVMDRIAGRALDGRSGIRFEPAGVIWTLDVPATSAIAASEPGSP